MTEPERGAEIVPFPATADVTAVALEELELVYAFIYSRVGNRPDAEDLTQQVALKALPRLRQDAALPSIRAYLFATARSVLAGFWSGRFSLPEQELEDNVAEPERNVVGSPHSQTRVEQILSLLQPNHRRVLELRFLRGYSLKETAQEMGITTTNVKVMQLRALRAAAGKADV